MSLPIRVVRHSDALEAAQREFDQLFGRFFHNGNSTALAPYAVDVRENAETLIVDAELPGFTKDQIDITLENSVLTLSAERTDASSEGKEGSDYLLRERRYTRFQRSFTLPPTVDESSVNAKLENGVLTITLNKRQEAKPRKISVN
jgi:HSP20 family protein